MRRIFLLLAIPLFFAGCKSSPGKDSATGLLEILFLGHDSEHHDSEQLAEIISQEYFKDGINITYTNDPDYLTRDDLGRYDGLLLYANHDSISPAQTEGLLAFVESGKGFIPLHCASWCFRNSPEVVDLIGGQFKSHEGGSFSAEIIQPEHPAMQGVESFTTEWDETYVHDKFSDEITVLMERVEGEHREPYTWVRNYGKGRVFYTAFGHDERTFRNPGFLQLVKSGLLWAVGDAARERLEKLSLAEPVYEPGKMPNYEERDPPPLFQHALSPEESMSQIQVPAGFALELFAAEPDIINPMAMTWDEKGRLWVIETKDYPNTVIETPGAGDDRIKICEDTDGDGRADKFTVFADSLNIPTSMVFADGGLIVSQAPYFLFLKDTDGDDKADVREVLFEGWGKWDTHAGPSNLQYGMDNRIWGTVGYSGFEGMLAGKPMKFGSGLYRFRPDGSSFEFMAPTSNNTWGLGFSEEFDVFLSTANNEHSDHFAIPDRFYKRAGVEERGIEKIDGHYEMHVVTKNLRQVDVHGGFTAAAGHQLYTARAFPREYWNRIAFVCEPTGRLIHNAVMEHNGSGFREKDGWNFTASADEWFGPVQAKVGPDGALWVLDWYNFIIQHNPTPEGFGTGPGNAYIDSLREYTRGRIYRIAYKDAPEQQLQRLDREQPEELIAALKHPNMFWRLTAQRLLVESGDQQHAESLYELVRNTRTDDLGINAGAMHALWTLKGLGLIDGKSRESLNIAFGALKHPAAGVRKAAIQVLPRNEESRDALIAAGLLQDADLRVRLAAILALIEMPASAESQRLLAAMPSLEENNKDKWISHALQIASNVHGTDMSAPDAGEAGAALGEPDQVIQLSTVVNQMKYDQEELKVKAGSTVKIVFTNPDHMQHNLLILQPGSLDKVGAAADQLATDPEGSANDYIPEMPEVLFTTPLVDPQGSYELLFKVPDKPGKYPYVCTFPGHWRMMKGVMVVE